MSKTFALRMIKTDPNQTEFVNFYLPFGGKLRASSVHVDRIYRARENRSYCKAKGICLSGKPLGHPRKATSQNQAGLYACRLQWYEDELSRIPIEGKFGNSKRRGTLARIMAKLSHTSESVIYVGLVVLNLQTWLRKTLICLDMEGLQCFKDVLSRFACYFFARKPCHYGRWQLESGRLTFSA